MLKKTLLIPTEVFRWNVEVDLTPYSKDLHQNAQFDEHPSQNSSTKVLQHINIEIDLAYSTEQSIVEFYHNFQKMDDGSVLQQAWEDVMSVMKNRFFSSQFNTTDLLQHVSIKLSTMFEQSLLSNELPPDTLHSRIYDLLLSKLDFALDSFLLKVCVHLEKEPDIKEVTWNEDNLGRYMQFIKADSTSVKKKRRKMFFVDPIGTLKQNDLLMNAVVNYIDWGFLHEHIWEQIVSYETPVFSVHAKLETEPCSGVFIDMVFDLYELAEKRQDKLLLHRIKAFK